MSIGLSSAYQAQASDRIARKIVHQHALQTNDPGGQQQTTSQADAEVRSASGILGRLEIPMVALSVPVVDDFDPDSLERGVGHIPGTALPGGLGNLVLAGHRDTYFRLLRNVRKGMEVDVATISGKYRYSIDSTEVVSPEQVEVLEIRSRPELTLITCFPFNYIGAAPRRFIVHAHLLSLDPA